MSTTNFLIKAGDVWQMQIDLTSDLAVVTDPGDTSSNPNAVVDANYVHTDNNYTTAEKAKLANLLIETGASIISKLGFTPVPSTRQITINGTTHDLSQNSNWVIATDVGSVSWGNILGTLSGQIDLQDALDAKQPTGDYATNSALTSGLTSKADTLHTQAAATITEDSTHRFVTDTEKSSWNSKTTNISDAVSAAIMDSKDAVVLTAAATAAANADKNASTITGQKTSAFISDFNSAVDSRIPITPRVQSVTSSATVTPNSGTNDAVKITAQATGLTLANWSGTPAPMQSMVIRIKDNGTARTIAYGTQYRAIGIMLPTTTVINKTIYLGCIWNSEDTKIDVVGYSLEA